MLLPIINTQHVGQKLAESNFSPRLWSRILESAMPPSGNAKFSYVHDDFMNFSSAGALASNLSFYSSEGGGYATWEDTGGLVSQLGVVTAPNTTVEGGICEIKSDNSDNDSMTMQSNGGTGVLGQIDTSTTANDFVTAFEVRFSVNEIASARSVFLGLSEPGLCIADGVYADGGAPQDKDRLGFESLEGDPDKISFIWKKAGQTVVTLIDSLQVPVAGTFYNMGFIYDPKAVASKRMTIYVDNVEQATYGTATQLSAATFPVQQPMCFTAALKNGAGAIHKLLIDSWAFGQVQV